MYLQVGDCSHDDCDQGVVDYTHGAAAQKQVRQPRITFSMSHFPRALLAALNCLVHMYSDASERGNSADAFLLVKLHIS